ncbi:MAG TPA: amidohydrolase family protein [Thermoleophilia bacterium]|nr:amidohydrolase family protein [Thermoleophilia bacterium]
MTSIDLSEATIVDGHCHPFLVEEISARPPLGLENRCSFVGSCWFPPEGPRREWDEVFLEHLTDSTAQTLTLRRWLADHLGCPASKEAVATARASALEKDGRAYVAGLLAAEKIVALVVDQGTPGHITHDQFDHVVDVPVYRAYRIEPWIDAHRDGGFQELLGGFRREAEAAAAHPRMVAFKSYIHALTGCDIGNPTEREARSGYERWRDSGWQNQRVNAKPLFDFLVWRTMEIALRREKAVHFHLGGAGTYPCHARPFDLHPFISAHASQPIVLIHTGWPWLSETSYLVATFPSVYADISQIAAWAPSQLDWVLEMLLGWVPASKILYGSDECVEPEQIWLAAKFTRSALARTLQRLVERDLFTTAEGQRVGEGVLAGNTCELHRIHWES